MPRKRKRKGLRFTKEDHIAQPDAKKLAKLEEILAKDNEKGRHHYSSKVDYITGYQYKYQKQPKYKDICGTREMGLVALSDIEAGEYAFVSPEPGVPLPLNYRTFYKNEYEYHFIGRNLYGKSTHPMKANIISMANGVDTEKANARLEAHTFKHLKFNGYHVNIPGTYAVIVTTEKVLAGEFVNVGGYGNPKDYPFGTKDYLELEKQTIQKYEMNEQILLQSKSPRLHLCLKCCEIYDNNKSGKKNPHEKECTGNLLAALWEKRKAELYT